MAATKPIPINVAEAIIEPFWVPELSRFGEWEIDTSSNGRI